MSSGIPEAASTAETRFRRFRAPDRHRLLGWGEAYAMVGLLVLTGIFFCFLPSTADTFPTVPNLQAIAANQAVIAVVAIAVLVPLIAGEWDLSVGANAALSAVFFATALGNGTPIWLAVLIAVGIGAAIGVVNALLVTRVRVNAVITTLGVATVLEGVLSQKTSGTPVATDIPASIVSFGSGETFGIPRPAWAMLLIALAVYYVLTHTPAGRQLYALGSNRAAATLVGLRTRWLVVAAVNARGAQPRLAGVLQVGPAGAGRHFAIWHDPHPKVGVTLLLPAFAAAFLSTAAIKPGRPNVFGLLVAIFFLATLNGGLNLAGSPTYVSQYVNGAALVVGVALAEYLGRRRSGAQ